VQIAGEGLQAGGQEQGMSVYGVKIWPPTPRLP